MRRSLNAALPSRFTEGLVGPTIPIVQRTYDRAHFNSQFEEIEEETARLATDVTTVTETYKKYVDTAEEFHDFLPRIRYVIDQIRDMAKGALRKAADDFQAALDILLAERDELMEDQPKSLEQLKKLNQMQKDFVNALSEVANRLPAVQTNQPLEAYLFDNNTIQQQDGPIGMEGVVTAQTFATPEIERPQGDWDFWGYWKLMVRSLNARLNEDTNYRLEANRNISTGKKEVQDALRYMFDAGVDELNSLNLAQIIIKYTPDSTTSSFIRTRPRQCNTADAERLKDYPRNLYVSLNDEAKTCVDKFTYATNVLNDNRQRSTPTPTDETISRTVNDAVVIFHVYTMLADALGMAAVDKYQNSTLRQFYRTFNDNHRAAGFPGSRRSS